MQEEGKWSKSVQSPHTVQEVVKVLIYTKILINQGFML